MSETNKCEAQDSHAENSTDYKNLAKLCSVGAVPIPNDMSQTMQREVLCLIATNRRNRLLHLFADAIAEDILREHKEKESTNAQQKL